MSSLTENLFCDICRRPLHYHPVRITLDDPPIPPDRCTRTREDVLESEILSLRDELDRVNTAAKQAQMILRGAVGRPNPH
jgi:hypothetical protein